MLRNVLVLIAAGQAMQLSTSAILSTALTGPVDLELTVLTLTTIIAAIFVIGDMAKMLLLK